jgi:hypothetical protein
MEEEAKIRFNHNSKVAPRGRSHHDGAIGYPGARRFRLPENVGLQFADGKRILGRLQEIVVGEQLERHCEAARPSPGCHRQRHVKDHRHRRFETDIQLAEGFRNDGNSRLCARVGCYRDSLVYLAKKVRSRSSQSSLNAFLAKHLAPADSIMRFPSQWGSCHPGLGKTSGILPSYRRCRERAWSLAS